MDNADRVRDVVQACKALSSGDCTVRFYGDDALAAFLKSMGGRTLKSKSYNERTDKLVEYAWVTCHLDGVEVTAGLKDKEIG